MPALPTEVQTYITSITDALNQGTFETQFSTYAAAQNYLRAMDMANILDLLQDAVLPTGSVTATGGSTTTAVIASMEANLYSGSTVTFDDATLTAGLQGVSATVRTNDGTTFTFTEELPAACAAGDTFTIDGSILEASILALRNGRTEMGDSPLANVYGLTRVVNNAFEQLFTISPPAAIQTQVLSRPGAVTIDGSTVSEVVIDTTLKIDAMQGYDFVIAGETRQVASNTENTVLLSSDLSSAPAAGVAYSIQRNLNQVNNTRKQTVHPGGHPDNRILAYQIELAVESITAVAAVPA